MGVGLGARPDLVCYIPIYRPLAVAKYCKSKYYCYHIHYSRRVDARAQLIMMMGSFPPSTMRAWQYSSTKGGLERNLKINLSVKLPKPKPDQHLVQIIATALNPIDYKPAEIPGVARFVITKPATPGIDFAGSIVRPAPGSPFMPG